VAKSNGDDRAELAQSPERIEGHSLTILWAYFEVGMANSAPVFKVPGHRLVTVFSLV
jgi:hypothetical protein